VYEDGPRGSGTVRTKKMKPAREHITFPIPPLITIMRWDRIQEKIASNKIKAKRCDKRQRQYWLRDLLKCGHCGANVKPHHGETRKDGTFLRYYSCYWSFASPQELSLSNKSTKCKLPLIKAEQLEKEVWRGLIQPVRLALNPKKLSPLIDPDKYDVKIRELEDRSKRLKQEHFKKEKARIRLYEAYEDVDFDKDELKKRLEKNHNEQLKIYALINEAQRKRDELKEAKKNDSLLKNFLNNKKDTILNLIKDLTKLFPDDRKTFVEACTRGKIKLGASPNPEFENEPKWEIREWNNSFNMPVLQDFMDRGVMGKYDDILSKTSPDHPSADDIRRSH